MGNWNADWALKLASGLAYKDCVVGDFTLKEIDADTFEVTGMEPPAKWQGVMFKRRPGSPGPLLGWPLLTDAKDAHSKAAGKWVREKVQEQWDASHLQFECLEGEVPNAQEVEKRKKILLFKSDKGFQNGQDFLVGIFEEDLEGVALPDGSVSGRRR